MTCTSPGGNPSGNSSSNFPFSVIRPVNSRLLITDFPSWSGQILYHAEPFFLYSHLARFVFLKMLLDGTGVLLYDSSGQGLAYIPPSNTAPLILLSKKLTVDPLNYQENPFLCYFLHK